MYRSPNHTRKTVVTIAVFTMTAVLFAPAFAANGKVKLDVDHAVFYNKQSGNYIEIYYGFDKNTLTLSSDMQGPCREALIGVTVTKAEEVVVNDIWRMRIDESDSLSESQAIGVVKYGVDPGLHRLNFQIVDVKDRSIMDSVAVEFEVQAPGAENLYLSDIELANKIQKAGQAGQPVFVKNSLEVVPNPERIYGENRPVLFYYLETRGLLAGVQGDTYQTLCWLADAQMNDLPDFKVRRRTKKKRNDATVEVGTLNISKLPSGVYHLNVAISEVGGEPLVTQRKKFFVYNSDVAVARPQASVSQQVSASIFATMTEEQLDREYEYMKYIINEEGEKLYASLTNLGAKREFLYKFWKMNDPDPQTTVNEYRDAYLKRIDYANEHFRRMGKEGWKTDRGRVFMIYGAPSFIDRFTTGADTHPYEIWTYDNLEGGVEFVFVDASGIREYVLVHSTMSGEVKNENWLHDRAAILR